MFGATIGLASLANWTMAVYTRRRAFVARHGGGGLHLASLRVSRWRHARLGLYISCATRCASWPAGAIETSS